MVGALWAQDRRVPSGFTPMTSGRFTVAAYSGDFSLARSLLADANARDTFPGLPRPRAGVVISLAPDARRFRDWVGAFAPEWGVAIAIPAEQRIVMQGSRAPSAAGNPAVALRHELAHLALHEQLGDLPARWFDEGYASYAAGEWARDEVLATNLGLVLHRVPSLNALDSLFTGGTGRAQQGYALAHLAVTEIAALDRQRGLTLFFGYWRETRSFDQALRRAFGITESAFEDRWKRAARRQYGGVVLLADASVSALALLLLFGPLWLSVRQRTNRRIVALRVAESAQEARDRETVLAALLAERGLSTLEPGSGRSHGAKNDDLIN